MLLMYIIPTNLRLLMAKSALELSEEKYAHLQEEHDLALEKKDRNLAEMSDQLNTKNQVCEHHILVCIVDLVLHQLYKNDYRRHNP